MQRNLTFSDCNILVLLLEVLSTLNSMMSLYCLKLHADRARVTNYLFGPHKILVI
jgi:hypothetical protein